MGVPLIWVKLTFNLSSLYLHFSFIQVLKYIKYFFFTPIMFRKIVLSWIRTLENKQIFFYQNKGKTLKGSKCNFSAVEIYLLLPLHKLPFVKFCCDATFNSNPQMVGCKFISNISVHFLSKFVKKFNQEFVLIYSWPMSPLYVSNENIKSLRFFGVSRGCREEILA